MTEETIPPTLSLADLLSRVFVTRPQAGAILQGWIQQYASNDPELQAVLYAEVVEMLYG